MVPHSFENLLLHESTDGTKFLHIALWLGPDFFDKDTRHHLYQGRFLLQSHMVVDEFENFTLPKHSRLIGTLLVP
jgi:hypothetical protein